MSTDCAWADPRQEELKPCPFCGGKAKLVLAMGQAWILCPECESSGPMSQSIEGAVGIWNKRVVNGPDWVALHDSLSKGLADLNEQCRRTMAEISLSIREAIQRGEE